MRHTLTIALVALALGGCFGQPGSRDEDALGDVDHDPAGPEHRPGQPCLVCHGADYTPGGDVFSLAGTVFETPSSTLGLSGVSVLITDASGRVWTERSNRAGNFYIEGERELAYPLHVALELDGERIEMRSPIMREGSCAHCHTKDGPGAASVGRVYLRETP